VVMIEHRSLPSRPIKLSNHGARTRLAEHLSPHMAKI
jgi:hypothetical protein